jgi:hypothetical protein
VSPVLDSLTDAQVESFRRDGFVIVEEGMLSDNALDRLRERFKLLFDGEYETGIKPDEVNWEPGRDPEDRTRQICNGWRADNAIAAQVLAERTGRMAAQLMGYSGTRILQDNLLWKPPGAKSIGMHQDGSYASYLVPPEMVTCWIALDDTQAGGNAGIRARLPSVAEGAAGPVAVPCPGGLAGGTARVRAGGRGVRGRAGGGRGRGVRIPSQPDVARLGLEHEPGGDPPGARIAHAAGPHAVPP